MTRRRLAVGGIVLVAAAIVAVAARPGGRTPARQTSVPAAVARIVRTDVVERRQVVGTLAYAGSFAVSSAGAAGVVTWLPQPGAIVRRGRPLFELDGAPVPLLYASRPAYRAFALGMTVGADVRALQRNLRALGYGAPLDGAYGVATLAAVEAWQRALGMPVTGELALGSVVFLPGPVRVGSLVATAGSPVHPGAAILSATSTAPAVLVPLDPGGVSQLEVGDPVLVTLPDSTSVPGKVTAIGRVATTEPSDNGAPPTPTVPVTIGLRRPPRAGLDQAPVQVSIVEQEARGVLAAPVAALLARPGGGYAVEVVQGASTRLVPVTTGLFDEVAGLVELSGAGLTAGQRVEVPAVG